YEPRGPCPRADGERWQADGVPARRVLAVHGHAARQASVAGGVATGTGAVEGVGMSEFWRDRPVLVTGATGLLGGWLVRMLEERGADVVCVVRDWVPQSEIVRSQLIERVKTVRGDVRDRELLERVLGEYEIDTVIHLAAQTIVRIANR